MGKDWYTESVMLIRQEPKRSRVTAYFIYWLLGNMGRFGAEASNTDKRMVRMVRRLYMRRIDGDEPSNNEWEDLRLKIICGGDCRRGWWERETSSIGYLAWTAMLMRCDAEWATALMEFAMEALPKESRPKAQTSITAIIESLVDGKNG